MFNALIQLKIIQYWWWFWRQWCRDVASGIDRHTDRTEIYFRLQIQGNQKLIPCSRTFREVFSHPYISFFHLLVNGFSVIYICLWTKKIFESYIRDRLTFSNIHSRTSRRMYRLALPLRASEMLSSLSKSRISIFNVHLTLFVRRMTSHNSIGKYRHLIWNLPWNGASPSV